MFEGEVEMVSTRTGTGSLGVLANHAPLMAMLEPSELKLYESGSENPGAPATRASPRARATCRWSTTRRC